MITRKLILSICFACSFLFVEAQYKLQSSTFSNGATEVSSSNYKLTPTVGQTISGEASSANHVLVAGFIPTAVPRLAELTLRDLKLSPAEAFSGGTTNLSFTLINSGGIGAFVDISAEIYFSGNQVLSTDDTRLDSVEIVSDLLPGEPILFPEEGVFTLDIPEDLAIGDYYIIVSLITSDALREINEDNTFPVLLEIKNQEDVDSEPPNIDPRGDAVFSGLIAVEVEDTRGVKSVSMFHRQISEPDFTELVLTGTGVNNIYNIETEDSWADEFGMEAYFIAEDQVGNATVLEQATHYYWYRQLDEGQTIPLGDGFDGKSNTYRMFSVPYTLQESDVVRVFDELGTYDDTQWRIFHWIGERYAEYQDGLDDIEPGKGYWFNTIIEDFDIEIENEIAKDLEDDPAFVLSPVRQGWNQIGNPYPFPIDWQVVQDANSDLQLTVLQKFTSGSYIQALILEPWEGAFVFSQSSGSIEFPVESKFSNGGRADNIPKLLDGRGWEVPINLEIDGITHRSTFGMHPDASESKDRFDQIIVPRFFDYVELYTNHEEFFAPKFAADIVSTKEHYTWDFTLESNLDGLGKLNWDLSDIWFSSSEILMLMDMSNGLLIDLRNTESYAFKREGKARDFKIFYSATGEFEPGFTGIGQGYPNPFEKEVVIPIIINSLNEAVELQIFDETGRQVASLEEVFHNPGIGSLKWNGLDFSGNEVPAGVYFYRLSGNINQVTRLIKTR